MIDDEQPLLASRPRAKAPTCGNRVQCTRRVIHRGVCVACIVAATVVLLTSSHARPLDEVDPVMPDDSGAAAAADAADAGRLGFQTDDHFWTRTKHSSGRAKARSAPGDALPHMPDAAAPEPVVDAASACETSQLRVYVLTTTNPWRETHLNPMFEKMLARILGDADYALEQKDEGGLVAAAQGGALCPGDVVVLGGLSLDHTCQYTWSDADPLLLAESQATRAVLASSTPLQILWMDNHCRTTLPVTHHRVYLMGTPLPMAAAAGSVVIPFTGFNATCSASKRVAGAGGSGARSAYAGARRDGGPLCHDRRDG